MNRLLIILAFLLLEMPNLSAQDNQIEREFSGNFGFGGILAHNKSVRHLAQSHPVQTGLEYFLRNPSNPFGSKMKNAGLGYGLHYIDYRSEKLGKSLAALIFLEPAIGSKFAFRIGTGISWNSRPFSLEDNTSNTMLGSRLSGAMQARLMARIPIGKNGLLKSGIGLTHFSNGAYSLPNMGINHFYLFACLGLLKKYPNPAGNEAPKPKVKIGWNAGIFGSVSAVERYPINQKKYTVWQIQTRINYRKGLLSGFSSGLDFMYNAALASRIKEYSEEKNPGLMIGIPLGHELFISDRLSLISEAGVYLSGNQKFFPAFYQRYGIRYKTKPGICLGILLKTHRANAECMELNLGYSLGK